MEVCDGNDNDCNGLTDEGLGQTTCGLGLCQQTITNCQDGQVQQCDPSAGAVDEFCDGLDNDCDGKVDEEQPSLACGKGLCFHTISSCLGGVIQECDPFAGAMPEVCDGVDNDCDGEKDEELGQVTCGLGPCEHTIDYCQEGKIQVCNPFEGVQAEICDGADNDCDGLADEELGFLQCGLGMCAHTVTNCINGQPQECDPFEGALDEICDGLDNDCDGGADEDLGLSTCGQGECQHTIFACTNGQLTECDPFEGAVDEICDGLDNNCDGDIDEGFVDTDIDGDADCIDTDDDDDGDLDDDDCQPLDADIGPSVTEICFDGVDNDCDGLSADDPECLFESCEALLAAYPEATDGSYTLDVDGEDGTLPFDTVCDMANGGWTLILKATGTKTLWYGSGYWTDDTLLADDDLTTDAGDAKYASFLHLPVTVMKGCLDDHCYSKTFDGAQTAKQIFSGGASVVSGLPGFGTSEKWSAQPNCQHFGINTPYNYQSSRFGYTANQEGDCNSNDTAVGLGLGPKGSSAESSKKGAGFLCISSNCSKGNVDSGATGLLWVR